MKITLKIYERDEEKFSKVLDVGVYRVGRSEFSDIVLDSDKVSRSHLEIRVSEASAYMTNMAPAGRVKVNGQSKETSELADGDELQIGSFRIVVFHGERDVAPVEAAGNPLDGGGDNPAEGDGNLFGNADGEQGGDGGNVVEGAFGGGGGDEAVGGGAIDQGNLAVAFEEAPQPSVPKLDTHVSMKPVVAKLVFTDGPRKGEELFLEAYEISFGRSKKADIFLDDEKISRVHAKIVRVGMGYRLVDLNSRNGTFVNGMRVLEHPLTSFDQIEIGKSKIKFLIHDALGGSFAKGGDLATLGGGKAPLEQTRSLMISPAGTAPLPAEGVPGGPTDGYEEEALGEPKKKSKAKIYLAAIALLGALYFLLPSAPEKGSFDKDSAKVAETAPAQDELAKVQLPPGLPKEYLDLNPDVQREIEGYYNQAKKLGEAEQFEEATAMLKRIHEYVPFYKESKILLEQFQRKLKQKQAEEVQSRAKQTEAQDLDMYLKEGIEYLKEGDFDRAAEAFNSAIVIDPTNKVAIKGLKAAEARVRDIEQLPPEKDPEEDKRKLVSELFQKAVNAFTAKSYQEAIDTAEKIRQIELKGDTQYLNEAKQIIDRARILQKEEFEPFLIQAKEKYAEGDYNASRDLCEEMAKKDSSYDEAKECVLRAKKQLNRLAKEAYTHGYILESMNRIEEAKQYWNRARNYVRQGDEYYDKVNKKLDYYQ